MNATITAVLFVMPELKLLLQERQYLIVCGFFASALTIVLAALLFWQWRISRKTSEEISFQKEKLKQLAEEKEWLLKEVHHRVKNNLHMIICLLESQAMYLKDDALKAVENSQYRIFAMSLIHQKMYIKDHISTIDMAEYIPELVTKLGTSFDVRDSLNFTFNIDPVKLNSSYAIPLGLIINEAVTNAIKYAFPLCRTGSVHVALLEECSSITLLISDDGVGFLDDPSSREFDSMGIELMKGLSAEINANIRFENSGGSRITVTFVPSLQL
jgi:two-component sensor histidine kinase